MAFTKREIVLEISGVTCNSCVQRIKSHLHDKYPNLVDYDDPNAIKVDLSSKTFTFQLKDNTMDSNNLIKTIEAIDAKYKCVPLNDQFDSPEQYEKKIQKVPLIGSRPKNGTQPKNGSVKQSNDSTRKCYLSVQGMTCSSCVDRIEKKLRSTEGVVNCQVGLIAARAEVDFDYSIITPTEIVDVLDNMGYDTALISVLDSNQQSELKLEVIGVTTQENCDSIKLAISDMIGVASVAISLGNSQTTILYYHDLIGPRKIADKIESLGYSVYTFNSFNPKSFTDSLVKEIAKWRTSFLISLIFGVPTILAMIYFMYIMPSIYEGQELHEKMCCVLPGLSLENLVLFALSTPVQIFGAKYFYIQAFKSLRNRHLSMDVLIMLATTIAYIYSVCVCVYFMITQQKQSPITFFDTPPMLLVFISLGRWLEHASRLRTTEYIVRLMSMRPFEATLLELENGNKNKNLSIKSERVIPIDLVEKGDYLRVRPGERVPTDGRMIDGIAMVDESFINGESMPVSKKPGSLLLGGSIVSNGTVIMVATNVGADSQLCQIVKMVENAQTKKAPIQQLADRISSYFIPFVIFASLLAFIVWLVIGNQLFDTILSLNPQFYANMSRTEVIIQFAFQIGLSVMIISCPCALGIATPSAVIIGTGIGAVNGIHIKGAEPLEKAEKIKMMLFDKTGTLTYGKPSVTNMILLKAIPSDSENEMLRKLVLLVGMAESNSDHPIAVAVANYTRTLLNMDSEASFGQLSKFKLEAGLGIQCEINLNALETFLCSLDSKISLNTSSKDISYASFLDPEDKENKPLEDSFFDAKSFDVLIGNKRWLKSNDIGITKDLYDELIRLEMQGETVFFVVINREPVCLISVADTVKPEARLAIYSLRKMFGVDVMLLTGDNVRSARAIGRRVGIKKIYGELLPQHKMNKIKQLQASGVKVAMVGDGINDAPAMAQADLGIAIAKGTDITIESADIVLKKDDLLDIVSTIHLSSKTMQRIRINFLLAFIYNLVFIPVAAGVFIYFGLILQPWMSGACMAFSSISVSCSSLLLRRYQKPSKQSLETDDYRQYQRNLRQQLTALSYNETEQFTKLNEDQMSLHNAHNLLTTGKRSVNDLKQVLAMQSSSEDDDSNDDIVRSKLLVSQSNKCNDIDLDFVSKIV